MLFNNIKIVLNKINHINVTLAKSPLSPNDQIEKKLRTKLLSSSQNTPDFTRKPREETSEKSLQVLLTAARVSCAALRNVNNSVLCPDNVSRTGFVLASLDKRRIFSVLVE